MATDADFDALRPLWNELFDHSTHSSPFCSWIWAQTWWEHYRASLTEQKMHLRLHVVCVYDACERLIGLAPLYFAAPVNAPFGLASLRPLGSRLTGTQEDLTEEPVLLLHADHEQEALRALVHHLSAPGQDGPHDYFVLRLYENVSAAPFVTRYETLQRHCVLLKHEAHPGQTVHLAKTWDHFVHGLSKSIRDNVKYYPRLLTRRGHVWEIETLTRSDEVREAARELVTLHRRRAASLRGIPHIDHLPTELQAGFLVGALQNLAEQGMASLFRLRIDGSVVAVLAVLQHARMISIYYSGFDPEWYDYSPITILTAEALRQAMADGYTSANFLPGEFPWKERWGAVSDRTMVQHTLLRRHPRALLRAGLEKARRTVWPPRPGHGTSPG